LNKKLVLIRSPQSPLLRGELKGGLKDGGLMGGRSPRPNYGKVKPKLEIRLGGTKQLILKNYALNF